MTVILAILRFAIPLITVLIIARFLWPHVKAYLQKQNDRIEVDAKVVKTEQHKPDYPKSKTYTSPDQKE